MHQELLNMDKDKMVNELAGLLGQLKLILACTGWETVCPNMSQL